MKTPTGIIAANGEQNRAVALAPLIPLLIIAGLTFVSLAGWLANNASITRMQEAKAQEHVASKQREEIDLRFNQGVVMLHARQYDMAVTAFHRVIELAPNLPEAHVNMGFALLGNGNSKAAADFFGSAIELRPHQLNAYYGMALAREASGDLNGAIEAMRAYLHRTPADDPYRANAEATLSAWQQHQHLTQGHIPSAQ